MSGILAHLTFFFLALCTTTHSSVPLFLWSGEGYFGDVNEPHPEVGGSLQLNNFIQDVMTTFTSKTNTLVDSPKNDQGSLTNYISNAKDIMPEVVVAFIYSKLDSTDVAQQIGSYSSSINDALPLSFLKNVLINSKSSLIVPHILIGRDFSTPTSAQLVDQFSSLSPQPEIVALQLDGEENIQNDAAGCKALLKQLDDNQQIFSNLVTDLIMIKADKFEDVQEDCMKSILDRVHSSTSGHFLAMLTADMPKTNIIKFFPTRGADEFFSNLNSFVEQKIPEQKPPVVLEGRKLLMVPAADEWPGVHYITSNILFALFFGGIFLGTVLCAVNCLLSVETPQRLSHRKYAIGKQS